MLLRKFLINNQYNINDNINDTSSNINDSSSNASNLSDLNNKSTLIIN